MGVCWQMHLSLQWRTEERSHQRLMSSRGKHLLEGRALPGAQGETRGA